jgi:hypothetical protein
MKLRDVKRWDIYDIADDLDDLPYEIMQAVDDSRLLPGLAREIQQFAAKLYRLSQIEGTVGPFPNYERGWEYE